MKRDVLVLGLMVVVMSLLLSPLAYAATSGYDFGGMFGWRVVKQTGGGLNPESYNNPFTNALSCPAGFTSRQIFGQTNAPTSPDGLSTKAITNLWICYRPTAATAAYDFGGVYLETLNNEVGATTFSNNPLTGGASCPAGFSQQQMRLIEWENYIPDFKMIHICYKSITAGTSTFGGIYGDHFGGGDIAISSSASHTNPITGGASCPAGFSTGGWGSVDLQAERRPVTLEGDISANFIFCYTSAPVTPPPTPPSIVLQQIIAPQRCINSDDVILRIEKPTGALGEVWNGANKYPIEICFSKIFLGYPRPSNPHACKSGAVPSNRVIQLNDATNAIAISGPR